MMNPKHADTMGGSGPNKGRRDVEKKRYWMLAMILLLVLGCTAYWVKSRLGIDLFESISASSHFPFNLLYNNVLTVDQPGTVLYEDFEQSRIFKRWRIEHPRGGAKVVYKFIRGEPGNSSRFLQISSNRKNHWHYKFSKYIAVSKGDLFQVKGRLHIEPDSKNAFFSITGFDADKNAIDWRMVTHKVTQKGSWINTEKLFSITDERVRYISFRLIGYQGVYRFDDLFLNKLDGPVLQD
jgi:hypothetical protein